MKTHITTQIPRVQKVSVRLPVIREHMRDLDDYEIACDLFDMGYRARVDAVVALTLDIASPGLEVRKARGEYVYIVADDAWFRKTLKIDEGRITLISPSGGLCLEPCDRVVIAKLEDVFGRRVIENLEALEDR